MAVCSQEHLRDRRPIGGEDDTQLMSTMSLFGEEGLGGFNGTGLTRQYHNCASLFHLPGGFGQTVSSILKLQQMFHYQSMACGILLHDDFGNEDKADGELQYHVISPSVHQILLRRRIPQAYPRR